MEPLKHECGVAMIRLLKPPVYYEKKYGTSRYGLDRLYLLMEKQHNRGQEGAGLAYVDLTAPVGTEYMFRERAEGTGAITDIFARLDAPLNAQLYMGHLRYSTTGKSGLTYVHPFLRRNNWRAKNLCLCGNFNMTNIDEVFELLTAQGQSPRLLGDAYIMLEMMGHRLDREVELLFAEAKARGLDGREITRYIDDHVSITRVLRLTMEHFDGGYVMCGLTGSGEMFVMRDPWGIRPAFYYQDDEIVAVASERPVLQTTFDLSSDAVLELKPGQALVVHRNGTCALEQILPAARYSACSFERIYFSRGSDVEIYKERKKLGELLVDPVLEKIGGDVEHTVFSYIPNTAEVAFYGLTDGLRRRCGDIRVEKVIWKDIKLRTFIAGNNERNDLAAHVYDVSYGSVRPHEDNLVVIDDSIVRGTTLHESILKMLDRLRPRKIIIVSSAPQIRYPDYYGIDMSHLEELCAFRAAVALIHERGMTGLLHQVYRECIHDDLRTENHVRSIYAPFTKEEINAKIVEMLSPSGLHASVELVFQSIAGLHRACENHPGDWYFSGLYPTPGGIRMVNHAFAEYYRKCEAPDHNSASVRW